MKKKPEKRIPPTLIDEDEFNALIDKALRAKPLPKKQVPRKRPAKK
jgi:hypothetical protein